MAFILTLLSYNNKIKEKTKENKYEKQKIN